MSKYATGASTFGRIRASIAQWFIRRPWRTWRCLPDFLAILWIALFVFLYLSPALKDGGTFGPADLGRAVSLLTRSTTTGAVHNANIGDIISQSIPWNTLDWRLVHAGQLPLWNSYSGTGLPQLLNWESAVFALPTIIGYAMPLSLSFIMSVAFKLLIAGTGAYLFCRLLGCRPLTGAFGGTVFMLAGNVSGWIGWSVSGPFVWFGWIAAASVLAYRSRGHIREVVLLAAVSAFTVYSGFPEGVLLLGIGFAVLLLGTGIGILVRRGRISMNGVGRIAAGLGAGAGLSAPLWLAGIPVLQNSVRQNEHAAIGLPIHAAVLVVAQGYYGLPIKGSYWFGPGNYNETVAYIGVVAVVCASAAVVLCWRRPVVGAITAAGVVSFLVVYQLGSGAPIQHLLTDVGLGDVAPERMQPILEFAVAVLGAIGLEAIVVRWQERRVQLAVLCPSVLVSLVLGVLWLQVGAARVPPSDLLRSRRSSSIPSVATLATLRRSSLMWPSVSIAVVVVLVVVAMVFTRRPREVSTLRCGRIAALALLVLESSFLLFAGVGINSYAHVAYPETSSVAQLQSIVGTKLVAVDANNVSCRAKQSSPLGPDCGVRRWLDEGIYPEENVAYQVDELALHDPTIPIAYFRSWPVANAGQNQTSGGNLFAPAVDSASLARRYGASFVLAYPRLKEPSGTRRVATLPNGQVLYAVPNSAQFVFDGRSTSEGAAVISVGNPDNATYTISVRVRHAASLILHLTDSPGWHVAVDGHPVAIRTYDRIFMAVSIPAGARLVTLSYWPSTLTYGIALALLAVLALVTWFATQEIARHRKRT